MKWEEIILHNFKTPYSYNKQENVILAERQTCRSMEQNRQPRKRSIQVCPIDFYKGTKANQWRN